MLWESLGVLWECCGSLWECFGSALGVFGSAVEVLWDSTTGLSGAFIEHYQSTIKLSLTMRFHIYKCQSIKKIAGKNIVKTNMQKDRNT